MKVGDYVRTDDGKIGKIGNITRYAPTDNYCMIMCENFEDYENNIIKSSPNIIDLIEVGDYVNGYRVCEIIEKNQLGCYEASKGTREKKAKEKSFCLNNNYIIKYTNIEIESVITKEQFSQMEYKVGD